MSKRKALNVTLVTVLVLMLISMRFTTAQEQNETTQTFFEFQWPGIEVQVNATSKAMPGESMTVILLVRGTLEIDVQHLDLRVFGFTEGQNKTFLRDIPKGDGVFSLASNDTKKFNDTFPIPEDVWGVTYGELSLEYESSGYPYPALSLGFTLTNVKNTELERLKKNVQSLSAELNELQQNHTWLKGNYTELSENHTELTRKYDELSKGTGPDNTRHIAIILAVTTVVFGATTVYLIIRKPKQTW